MISATLCAIIFPAPVVQVLPLERRSDRTSVFETGLTRARHEPAIGATKSTRLVGLRRSLASFLFEHDLRANASRLSRGKTGTHPRIKSEGMLFRIMLSGAFRASGVWRAQDSREPH